MEAVRADFDPLTLLRYSSTDGRNTKEWEVIDQSTEIIVWIFEKNPKEFTVEENHKRVSGSEIEWATFNPRTQPQVSPQIRIQQKP